MLGRQLQGPALAFHSLNFPATQFHAVYVQRMITLVCSNCTKKKKKLKTTLHSRTGLLGSGYTASRHPSYW
jgi:hypothetical protein